MATYRDKRVPPSQRGRYIRLDITYYTGPLEVVPHVPVRALTASAGRIDPAGTGPLVMTLPGLPQPWAEALKKISVQRTVYVWTDRSTGGEERGALYHFFIVNGRPAHRWEAVRSETTSRFRKHCYFAKVQVSLGGQGLHDVAAWDTFCQEFLRQAMPVVVEFLPSQTDLRQLRAREPSAEAGGERKRKHTGSGQTRPQQSPARHLRRQSLSPRPLRLCGPIRSGQSAHQVK